MNRYRWSKVRSPRCELLTTPPNLSAQSGEEENCKVRCTPARACARLRPCDRACRRNKYGKCHYRNSQSVGVVKNLPPMHWPRSRPFPIIGSQSVGFLYTKVRFLAPGPPPPPPAPAPAPRPKSADPEGSGVRVAWETSSRKPSREAKLRV